MCKCLKVEWQTKAEDVKVHCHVQMSKSGVIKDEDVKVHCLVQMSKSGVTASCGCGGVKTDLGFKLIAGSKRSES